MRLSSGIRSVAAYTPLILNGARSRTKPSANRSVDNEPNTLSCQNLSTIFGDEILTSRLEESALGGEASGEVFVEGVEEFLGGEPGLIGADQAGEVLGHGPVLDRFHDYVL
jgi:hypothetical protein